MTPRPALNRIARWLRAVGTVVAVLLVVFVVSAGYSASQLRPSAGPLGNGRLLGTNTVELTTNLTLSNPGFYPLSGLVVHAQIRFGASNGMIVATGNSPATNVPGGGNTELPLTVTVSFGTGLPTALLTHDARLPTVVWANATYAFVFPVQLTFPDNLSWGAPFYGLSVTPGTPTPAPNGTAVFPITFAFSNHARFGLSGLWAYSLLNAAGTPCGSGSVGVDAPSGANFQGGSTAYLSAGCDPRGGTVTSEFSSASWALPLPPEPLP